MKRFLALVVGIAAVALALPLSAADPADAASGTFSWWFEDDAYHEYNAPPAGQCLETGGEAVWARNHTSAPVAVFADRFCNVRIGVLEQGYNHPVPPFLSFQAYG
jgi:hypothetical protein